MVELISPYVEKDPTKFCTYEEFQTGTATLKEFCQLRAESIRGQLDGTIPATSDGQQADSAALVDASHLSISDMGTMNGGAMDAMGGGMPGGGFAMGEETFPPDGQAPADGELPTQETELPADGEAPASGESPPAQGTDTGARTDGGTTTPPAPPEGTGSQTGEGSA